MINIYLEIAHLSGFIFLDFFFSGLLYSGIGRPTTLPSYNFADTDTEPYCNQVVLTKN